MARLYDLAALAIALIAVGAILTAADIPSEQRAAALVALVGGLLIVASMRRRNGQ